MANRKPSGTEMGAVIKLSVPYSVSRDDVALPTETPGATRTSAMMPTVPVMLFSVFIVYRRK